MQAPRRLQLRRGNTAAVSSYLGAAGELIVNTDTNTLYIHDGVTVGGIATTVNVSTITNQITAANVGMRGYVDFSIQSNIANIAAGYTNTNVKSYLGSFDGNIIPSANVAYSLGNITHQWRDLFVSNTTVYIGGVPVSISASGNLTVNGNTIPTVGYVNTQIANVTVDLSSYALNANVTSANVGLKGYVDSQSFYSNTKVATYLASGPINISNVTISDNYGSLWRFTDSELQLPSGNGSPYGRGPRISSGAGIQIYPADDGDFMIQTYATGMGGSRQYTFTKLGNIELSDGGNIVSNDNIGIYSGNSVAIATAAGDTWLFGATGRLTTPGSIFLPNGVGLEEDSGSLLVAAPNDVILSAGTNGGTDSVHIKTNQETQVWEFNQDGNIVFPDTSVQTTAYSESAVRTFLAQHTDQTFGSNVVIQGNLFVNGNVSYISVNNFVVSDNIINLADSNPDDSLDLGLSAHRTVGGVIQHTGLVRDASANQWRLFSNVVPQPGTTVDFNNAIYDDLQLGNITSPTITAINDIITLANTIQSQQIAAANIGIIGYIDQANSIQSNQLTQANLGMKGYVDNAVSTIVIPVTYSNINVKAYTETMGFANYGNGNVASYLTTNNYLTSATANLANYAWNANITSGGSTYSNINVAAYLATATITTTGNITAQYLTGNINITGNVTGTSPNVTLVAGSFSSTFDNQGNVRVPSAYVAGNVTANYFVGNGALLTGIVAGSNYSNVQVATYLPTYSGNIANIRLGPSGVFTFADGTTLATASAIGGSTYGNANVASYLITNGYVNTNSAYGNGNVASYLITNQYINANSAYSNANVTSYLPTHSGNVGVNNIIGTTPNVTLVANSYSTTFDIYGNVAFGNAAYPVQIYATGGITTNSNLTVGGMGVFMPSRPAFRVNGVALYNGSQSTANVNLRGVAVSTQYNQGGYFDATTGKFTAPVAGIYEVLLNARVNSSYSGLQQLVVLKNGLNTAGNVIAFWESGGNTSTSAAHWGVSGTVILSVGDYLSANILAGNVTFDTNDNWSVTYLG